MTDKQDIAEYQEPAPLASTGTADMLLSPAAIDGLERAAKLMAHAKTMMPQHLQGSPGDCLGVLMQAAQWRMNPYALAQKTYLVAGRIGYEAQAIKAAIDSSPQLLHRLTFAWFGEWDRILGRLEVKKGQRGDYATQGWKPEDEHGLGVICYGLLRGETEPRELELRMTQAYPRNSTLWATDPKQQIAYLAAKRWARLHLPEVLLGVYDEEEHREIAITAPEAPVVEMPKRRSTPKPQPKPEQPAPDERFEAAIIGTEGTLSNIQFKLDACQTLDELQEVLKEVNALKGTTQKQAFHLWQARKDAIEAQ